MKWIRLKEVYGRRFRSFADPFHVVIPESGLTLIKGLNRDTGDGSASGKSSLVLAIAHLFGGCPFPATELASWYGDGEPAMVGGVFETHDGDYRLEKCNGQTLTLPSGQVIKGKAAAAEIDRIFGMDAEMRALTTYRGQGQGSLFLSMPDGQKKSFFTSILGLDPYERVAAEAAEKAKALREDLRRAEGQLSAANEAVARAEAALAEVPVVAEGDGPGDIDTLQEQAETLKAAARTAKDESDRHRKLAEEVRQRLDAELREKVQPISAAIRTVTVAWSEDVVAAKAELEKIQGRIEKVRAHDAKQEAEVTARRTELRVQIAESRKTRSKAAVEADIVRFTEQKDHLLSNACPTCLQDWVTDTAAQELGRVETKLLQLGLELEQVGVATEQAAALSAELKAILDFQPHPVGIQLAAKQAELQAMINGMEKDANNKRLQEVKALQERDGDIRAIYAKRSTQERAVHINAAGVLDNEAAGAWQAAQQLLSDIAEMKREWIEASTKRKERTKALEEARKRQQAAIAAHTTAETAMHAEMDLHALLGREGFLGVIFDDVLAEVAAATNEVLARVANVRHITFSFETEKETGSGNLQRRITPVVTVDGRQVNFSSGISGGQQAAVKLAVDLGVGEVVAKRRGAYPNWLVLDEVFDGLGGVAKESCMEMMQNYAKDRVVLVIDHFSDFQGLFEQTIGVESVDGRSRIV